MKFYSPAVACIYCGYSWHAFTAPLWCGDCCHTRLDPIPWSELFKEAPAP